MDIGYQRGKEEKKAPNEATGGNGDLFQRPRRQYEDKRPALDRIEKREGEKRR